MTIVQNKTRARRYISKRYRAFIKMLGRQFTTPPADLMDRAERAADAALNTKS